MHLLVLWAILALHGRNVVADEDYFSKFEFGPPLENNDYYNPDDFRGMGIYTQVNSSDSNEFYLCQWNVDPRFVAQFREVSSLEECQENCDLLDNCHFVAYNERLDKVKVNCRLYKEQACCSFNNK